jgi:hypothetical protein
MAQDQKTVMIAAGVGIVGFLLYKNGTLATWFPALFSAAQATKTTTGGDSTGGGAPPPPPPPPPAKTYTLSATITNASGGSASSFKVGDSWVVTVTGSPNCPVTSSGSFNGQSIGPTSFGNTDANGQLTVKGSLDSSSVGSWFENWYVCGQQAGSFNFTVSGVAKPAGTTPTSTPLNAAAIQTLKNLIATLQAQIPPLVLTNPAAIGGVQAQIASLTAQLNALQGLSGLGDYEDDGWMLPHAYPWAPSRVPMSLIHGGPYLRFWREA